MIITTILVLAAIIIAAVVLAMIGTIGAGLLVIFGDVIVFGLILWVIVKIAKLFKRKK